MKSKIGDFVKDHYGRYHKIEEIDTNGVITTELYQWRVKWETNSLDLLPVRPGYFYSDHQLDHLTNQELHILKIKLAGNEIKE